jgi:hypothetical protein
VVTLPRWHDHASGNLGQDLGWIEERLGLHQYPIVNRPYPEHGSRLFGWLRDR